MPMRMYMEVEAGALTSDIQAKANEAGLLYAGDPCSADSCMIGGNIATTPAATRLYATVPPVISLFYRGCYSNRRNR